MCSAHNHGRMQVEPCGPASSEKFRDGRRVAYFAIKSSDRSYLRSSGAVRGSPIGFSSICSASIAVDDAWHAVMMRRGCHGDRHENCAVKTG
eukprot:6177150-Pleurochrysis_carterae.AAC.1